MGARRLNWDEAKKRHRQQSQKKCGLTSESTGRTYNYMRVIYMNYLYDTQYRYCTDISHLVINPKYRETIFD